MSPVAEQRGVKRKRGATLKEDDPSVRITGKLHHAAREVRKVAKKAKAFETQKVVKKLKSLRAKDAVANEKWISEYEDQMNILKHLDHEPVANLALKTKLDKDRILSQNEHIQTAISSELSPNLLSFSAPGTAARKVENRLLSSKTLAIEVRSVVNSLKEVLDPSLRKAEEIVATEDDVVERPLKSMRADMKTRAESARGEDDDDDGDGDGSDVEVGMSEADGWESGSIQGGEDGWESGSINSEAEGSESESDSSEDEEELEDGDDDIDVPTTVSLRTRHDPQTVEKSKKPGKDPKSKSKTAAESTFLPSLSVGFTRGDSDASDISDGETKVADVRKNRRGQRARRAIWEKKYGKNANHVKKEHEAAVQDPRRNSKRVDTQDRSRAGAFRKGAAPGARSSFNAPPSDRGWSNNRQSTASSALATAKQKEDRPLHPSWEAKKRLKEKLNPVILAPQGKKITF